MSDSNSNKSSNSTPSESNVLNFPKSQSFRKRLMERGQDQKAVLGLSLVSVLVVTVFLNEWIVKSQTSVSSLSGGRQLASLQDRNSIEDVQWEHELAQKLAQDSEGVRSLLGSKPTLKDELVFGFLEGKYKTLVRRSKIEGFEFATAQAGEEPLIIKEKEEFLKIFKSVFTISYTKVQLDRRENGAVYYKLLSAANKPLGQALFQLDGQGRVLSLRVTQ
jgi:hypothetical protein